MMKWVYGSLYLFILGILWAVLFVGFNRAQVEKIDCKIICNVNIIGLTILLVLILGVFKPHSINSLYSSTAKAETLSSAKNFLTINNLIDTGFLHRVIVVDVVVILLLNSLSPFYILVQKTRKNAGIFLFGSTEAMKLKNFGDCGNIGYGYLEKIVSPIPEPAIFPTVRYRNYNRFPHILFADSRTQYDERLLVGIGLDENATQEVEITQAQLKSAESNPPRLTWTFRTGDDYDLLTGMVINFESDPTPQLQTLLVTLYESPVNFVVIGQWDVAVSERQRSIIYSNKDLIRNFSHNRGATDFILKIESTDNAPLPNINSVILLGVKVDISDYTVFNRDLEHGGRCFAAIKNSFLNEIDMNNDVKWQEYLNEVSNVSPDH